MQNRLFCRAKQALLQSETNGMVLRWRLFNKFKEFKRWFLKGFNTLLILCIFAKKKFLFTTSKSPFAV